MNRISATAPAPNFAGWHPLGLSGVAAAVFGLVMIASTMRADLPGSATSHGANAPPASARLERQRAGLSERLSRFPPTEQRAAQIAALGAIAHENGVVIGSGEYRNADSPMPGELATLEVRMPLRGTPPAVRTFVASLQREMPWLAIDQLTLERDGNVWRGEVRGRLFLRGGA